MNKLWVSAILFVAGLSLSACGQAENGGGVVGGTPQPMEGAARPVGESELTKKPDTATEIVLPFSNGDRPLLVLKGVDLSASPVGPQSRFTGRLPTDIEAVEEHAAILERRTSTGQLSKSDAAASLELSNRILASEQDFETITTVMYFSDFEAAVGSGDLQPPRLAVSVHQGPMYTGPNLKTHAVLPGARFVSVPGFGDALLVPGESEKSHSLQIQIADTYGVTLSGFDVGTEKLVAIAAGIELREGRS